MEGRGSQINAGGSDCLFPLFIYRHLRTPLKDRGMAGSTMSPLGLKTRNGSLLTQTMDITQR